MAEFKNLALKCQLVVLFRQPELALPKRFRKAFDL